MGKFKSSYALVKLAFTIINKEKELLAYSLFSAISFILILVSYFSFILGLDVLGVFTNMGTTESQLFDIVMTFIFYFLFTFVALFFNTAILTSVNRIIRGESNTFMQGIESAFKNIGGIFKWALVSAFISTILRIIQDKLGGWIGKLVVGLLGGAWNLATFFALPIIVLEKKKTKEALKDSVQMFKKGWGDMVVTDMTSGFFFIMMMIVLLIVSFLLFLLSVYFLIYLFYFLLNHLKVQLF